MNPVSKQHPLKQYAWGKASNAWNLVDKESLSVKLESMPPGEEELLHYHRHAQQFFFILKGTASFEIEGEHTEVRAEQGFYVGPNKKHKIMNRSKQALEFILCSQPSTADDRINLE
jgi:mannose-6-phosphate isomerase-like protein (cupin superfamily)